MKESKFTGGLLGFLGTFLLCYVIAIVTLGIGMPWVMCIWYKWVADHTVIDGKQMVFDGTGGSLFGQYIKWLLLTIITCGIYGYWVGIKLMQWKAQHTHLKD